MKSTGPTRPSCFSTSEDVIVIILEPHKQCIGQPSDGGHRGEGRAADGVGPASMVVLERVWIILAEFRGIAGELCVPLFELALPGEPITIANRRRWARKSSRGGFVSGERSERWLLFDDSVVREIAEHWRRRERFGDSARGHSSHREHSAVAKTK
jgi:hypothetical protein